MLHDLLIEDDPVSLKASPKQIARIGAIALGWTTFELSPFMVTLVASKTNLSVYHWAGPASNLFGPILSVFVGVWAAVFLLLLSARPPGRWRVAVWSGMMLSMPWIGVHALYAVLGSAATTHFRLPPFGLCVLPWALLVCLWRPSFALRFEQATRFASTVFAFVGVMGALCFCEAGWYWWSARSLNEHLPQEAVRQPQHPVEGAHPIIWVVLDELSYEQTFEHRVADLNLPAFDAIAAQATSLTHVVPAGIKTDRVLPALFTGRPVRDIQSSATGALLVRHSAQGKWEAFNQHDSVFQDALDLGFSTAVVGWYNPYCRILPEVLDHCYWTLDGLTSDAAAPTASFGSNLLQTVSAILGAGALRRIVAMVVHVPPPSVSAPYHVRDFRKLTAAADQVLRDGRTDFVLIHLPVPHPEGIFDRRTGELTTQGSSYIDNLALADRCLGRIRADLEGAGQWDTSTVIVMGDHSWRTMIWTKDESWTAEDDRASSGGKFDDRPAYLVKLPGQHTGARLDDRFPAERTRALLDGVLTRRIQSPEDLRAWVERGDGTPSAPSQPSSAARLEPARFAR